MARFPLRANYSGALVGANCVGITNYGHGDLLPYANAGAVTADLQAIHDMNGSLIRVFAANDLVSDQESANRLLAFLNLAQTYGIQVIASLTNFYGDNGFHCQLMSDEYTDSFQGIPLLGDPFFSTTYRVAYMDFVHTVVSTCAGHPALYAWEPGNELKDLANPTAFIAFLTDVTNTIKAIDPVTRIASGIINAANVSNAHPTPDQFYGALPLIDVVTVHSYNKDHSGAPDIQYAARTGKIGLIEEGLIGGTGDRTSDYQTELDFWISQGMSGFLQWGFIASGLSDTGDGDSTFGMDTLWHTDYASLFALLRGTTFGNCQGPQDCVPNTPCVQGICGCITDSDCGQIGGGLSCCPDQTCQPAGSCPAGGLDLLTVAALVGLGLVGAGVAVAVRQRHPGAR
jgi:hypothetical protein